MSDKKEAEKKKPEAAPEEAAKPKKKGGMKIILVVAVAMVVEAVAIFALVKMGGPAESKASTESHNLTPDVSQVPKELLVADDKFQNMQTGRVWVWDIAIYVQVKHKNTPVVEEILKRRGAAVKEGISQIMSRAQHAQLTEPERQTLNRQITTFLEKLVESERKNVVLGAPGGDAKGDGHGGGGHGGGDHGAAAPAAHEHTGPPDTGPLLDKVMIPKCRGYPTDL
jgi:flagellar basal body-associated protein FliL